MDATRTPGGGRATLATRGLESADADLIATRRHQGTMPGTMPGTMAWTPWGRTLFNDAVQGLSKMLASDGGGDDGAAQPVEQEYVRDA